MGWLDDIGNSWDQFLGTTPNAAGDVRSAVNPAVASMRAPNGRLDPAAISSGLDLAPDDAAALTPEIKAATALGNLRQQLIGSYQAPPRSGLKILGDVMRAASVPISSYQGNLGYANNMQDALSKEAEGRTAFDQDRARLNLDNADKTISGIGDTVTSYYGKKQALRLQMRQKVAQQLQSVAIEAAANGQDPHEAQARALKDLAPELRINGFGDDVDTFMRAYASPSNPTPTPTLTPQQAPSPGQTSPNVPIGTSGPVPTQVASNGPVAIPNAPPSPDVPDFAKGLRMAAGGPADVGPLPAAPDAAPALPSAAPPAQPDVPLWKKYQDLARRLLVVDPERSKMYEEQAQALIKTRKVIDIADADGTKHPFWVDAADPSVPAVPVQPHEMQEAAHSRAKDIADGIESGDLPPETTGLYRWGGPVKSELAQRKVPLAKMQLEWKAAQAQVKGLNSDRLNRFVQLGTSVLGTMNDVQSLSEEMNQGGLTGLNAIQLQALIHAEGNSPRGQLATKYLGAVNTLKEEFANLANGGFAPTESAWKLANDQINGNFGVKQMNASLTELKRLINYRLNAVPGLSTFGAGSANRYTGADGSRAIGSTITGKPMAPRPMPKVGDIVANHIYKGGPLNDRDSWEEIQGAAEDGTGGEGDQ